MAYEIAKFLHITGVVMLMGNITASAIWKVFADGTGDPRIIGFAQRLVTITDWSLTFWGVVLTMVGGYGAVWIAGADPFGPKWLVWSQILFVTAGLMWLGMLVPIQIRQAKAARDFANGGDIPESYRRDSWRWISWGLIATVPLVAATWLMIAKPY
ncbi:MAG: DUF2269 domain-containing protein [Sphingomonas sp.]|uniref:DUF2269 family protein n=1 Tax=Sphingomonas sp. TaxID=28214 RepID=UPI0025E352E0|nr:DUF2269 domain-containing protein [Sphingomonas sp.]MBY0284466.1 DUF2269 domain-containing protein [Sphingomonas sp.]